MKTLLLSCLAFLVLICAAEAQTVTDSTYIRADSILVHRIDTTVPDYGVLVDSIFEHVSCSEVTTGLLAEKGYAFIDYKLYDGVLRDSVQANWTKLQKLAATFYTADCDRSAHAVPTVEALDSVADTVWKVTGRVPLAIYDVVYNYLKPNIHSDTLFTQTGIQLYDRPGRPQSPYLQKRAFGFASYIKGFKDTLAQFILPAAGRFTNHSFGVQSIQIDFGDGQGWRTAAWGQSFDIDYQSADIYTITLKLVDNNNVILYAKAAVEMEPRYVENGRPTINWAESWTIAKTSQHAGGNVQVSLACGHDRIIKPLIIAEGFQYYLGKNKARDNYTLVDFIDELDLYSFNKYPGLIDQLSLAGYDLIFLDYEAPWDPIERNAKLLEKVIQDVNTRKAANASTEENVVMGISMGGLVARWCLRTMENNSLDHDTRLFISFDAPHKGAYVPVGAQYAVEHLTSFTLFNKNWYRHFDEEQQVYWTLFCTPAQQMLFHKKSAYG